jgi:uncharacterized protein (UPF0332 family)
MENNQNIKEKILEKTAREYFESAEEELKKGRNNSSVVLFFKSLVAFVDLFILKKTGNTPSSHNYRFNICKSDFPEIYDLLDKDFPFYQDSYNKLMSKELAEVIKEDAKKVAEQIGFKI